MSDLLDLVDVESAARAEKAAWAGARSRTRRLPGCSSRRLDSQYHRHEEYCKRLHERRTPSQPIKADRRQARCWVKQGGPTREPVQEGSEDGGCGKATEGRDAKACPLYSQDGGETKAAHAFVPVRASHGSMAEAFPQNYEYGERQFSRKPWYGTIDENSNEAIDANVLESAQQNVNLVPTRRGGTVCRPRRGGGIPTQASTGGNRQRPTDTVRKPKRVPGSERHGEGGKEQEDRIPLGRQGGFELVFPFNHESAHQARMISEHARAGRERKSQVWERPRERRGLTERHRLPPTMGSGFRTVSWHARLDGTSPPTFQPTYPIC